jgi:hypothetical protein
MREISREKAELHSITNPYSTARRGFLDWNLTNASDACTKDVSCNVQRKAKESI